MNSTRQRYALEFEAIGDDSRPGIIRLRTLLKIALHVFRLKYLTIN